MNYSSKESEHSGGVLALDKFLPYVLVNLAKKMSADLADVYQREYDLSVAQWRVLANLNQAGVLTSKEVGLQTNMDKVKVSRAINRLIDRKWIKKKKHASDSRAYFILLSARGKRMVDEIIPKVLDWQADVLGAISEKEYETLLKVAAKLDCRLDKKALPNRR